MTEPTKISESLEQFGQTRESTCRCGATFTQTRMVRDWVPWGCSKCRGAIDDEIRASTAEATRVVQFTALGVPELYRGVRLDSYELWGDYDQKLRQGRMVQLARRYLANWPHVEAVVVFRGAPGTGKGHIAWSLVQQLVTEQRISALVCKLADAVRDLREAWRSDEGPSEAARLLDYRDPDLLVVDEISRHAFYGEPHRHLYDLIDYRVEHCRPTILTTNEDAAGLAEMLGPALVSRSAGSGIWEFGSSGDYRLRPPVAR
jgi:hypothetical protein